MQLQDPVLSVKGIGEKTALKLSKLHIDTVQDLILLQPRDYDLVEEPTNIISLSENEGNRVVIRAVVTGPVYSRKGQRATVSTVRVMDETGSVSLVFFNMPYISKTLKQGMFFYFRGRVSKNGNNYTLDQPSVLSENEYRSVKGKLIPVYPLTGGIGQKTFRKAVTACLEQLTIEDYLPDSVLTKYKFPVLKDAIAGIHKPENMDSLKSCIQRLSFDEFVSFFISLQNLKNGSEEESSGIPLIETADSAWFIEKLPFRLTEDQQKAWEDICKDMTSGKVMHRMIQGDVGSGKTILAVLALLLCVSNGYQGIMMAPTEVLAAQHYKTVTEYAKLYNLPFKPVLLTGSLKEKEKKAAQTACEEGSVNVIIGTHALFQEKVTYKNPGIIITDEQHRFGVEQRGALEEKGSSAGQPHVLVMSATPIPRSLALILYGDISISEIKTVPSCRLPVKNCVISPSKREAVIRFIEGQLQQKHQVFAVCPMIESNEESSLENVEDYAKKLKAELPDTVRIATLHGKMKPTVKNSIMTSFATGDIDVLVSTTVIEVGVNVPNATLMIIENADRYGLSQLHQLRGRVGRGDVQSYCIFVSGSDNPVSLERLHILEQNKDGFRIAEEDLRLRGPGDLFGVRQSGGLTFRFADIYRDAELMKAASREAAELTSSATKSIMFTNCNHNIL